MDIFVAGATGVIGQCLTRGLVCAGYRVCGMTRHASKAGLLETLGATPVIVDAFDAVGLTTAIYRASPQIIVNQLTDLSGDRDVSRNALIRTAGTSNLARAAVAANARRLVSQSILWAFAPSSRPPDESSPLDVTATGERAVTVGGVVALENTTLHTPGITGTVLRYGRLYGPGTGATVRTAPPSLHVYDAARAALIAIERCVTGIVNIAEPSDQANVSLGDALLPEYRMFGP